MPKLDGIATYKTGFTGTTPLSGEIPTSGPKQQQSAGFAHPAAKAQNVKIQQRIDTSVACVVLRRR
jgi:hypothetical protein